MSLGAKIKTLREEMKLSQIELANIMDRTQQAVDSWEHDRSKPTFDLLVKLSEVFNVTTDYLCGRTKNRYHIEQLDIADDLEKMVRELELQPDGLMYQGHPMNRETREILIANLRSTIELSKKFAREGKPTSREKIDELWRNIELLNEGEIDG